MPEKKKTTVSKSPERRMTKPQASKPLKSAAVEHPEGKPHPPGVAAAHGRALNSQKQLSTFESAMKLFHSRNLVDARELFRQAAQGPESDVANRARMHASMCDRRLEQSTVTLRTAEDYYNYGIALLNTRNAAEARTHLERALQMSPGADHVLYALALAQAMGGDLGPAFDNLRQAIDLEPRNRTMARQDTDFAHLAHQPPFDTLLYPEKKGW